MWDCIGTANENAIDAVAGVRQLVHTRKAEGAVTYSKANAKSGIFCLLADEFK